MTMPKVAHVLHELSIKTHCIQHFVAAEEGKKNPLITVFIRLEFWGGEIKDRGEFCLHLLLQRNQLT